MAKKESSRLKQKKDTLNRFLADEYVLVHVATRSKGVVVPEHLTGSSTVTLKLSNFFRGLMRIKEREVEAELLFGDQYFNCKLPFDAIWGFTSFKGQFLMWPESAPEEVLENIQRIERERLLARSEPATDADETDESDGSEADADLVGTEEKPRVTEPAESSSRKSRLSLQKKEPSKGSRTAAQPSSLPLSSTSLLGDKSLLGEEGSPGDEVSRGAVPPHVQLSVRSTPASDTPASDEPSAESSDRHPERASQIEKAAKPRGSHLRRIK